MTDLSTSSTPPSPNALPAVLVKEKLEVNDPVAYLADLNRDLHDLLNEADDASGSLTVSGSQTDYDRAVAVARRCADKKAKITDFIEEEFVMPARKLWKNNLALLASATAPLVEREQALSQATTAARKKRDDEARLAAETAAAAQRARDRQVEEDRKKERDRLQQIEDDKKLAAAKIAEDSGDHARAAQILDAPVTLPPALPPAPPPPPPRPAAAAPIARAAGEVRRVKWTGVVDDPDAFFALITAKRVIWSDFVEFKQGYLNEMAKKHQDKMSVYFPGLRAESIDDTSFRR